MSSLASPNPSHTFRLLAFGASMTEGFVGGQHTYPYAAHLRGPLEALFSKSSTTVEIIVDGEGGDQVVSPPGRFLPRLKRHCEDKEGGKGYDWVLIMGGTNDLGAGRKGEDIYEGLKKCWTVALDSGASVLAINIVESGSRNKELIQNRETLNALIAKHEEKNYYSLDICSAIPYFSMDEKQRREIWLSDALHLTAKGYKLMGEIVADRLVGILKDKLR